jgi:CDP-glucose 4,6-dehydratase
MVTDEMWDALQAAYAGRRVLVTGHTGFKGGWLLAWLADLGASVTGFGLEPPDGVGLEPPDAPGLEPADGPGLFREAGLQASCEHVVGDVRDQGALATVVQRAAPGVVFHLAAQPLVRASYERPVETIETNVMGTTHLLEAVRLAGRPCAVVVVTTDKVYEDRGWDYGYREADRLGGYDPYAASKAACELVVGSYRQSFFNPADLDRHGVAVATARAGNVVGGGDWALDRIVPDAVRALSRGQPVPVRNPDAVRPWQHVLEPLSGYLLLGAALMGHAAAGPAEYCDAWNFGPAWESAQPVWRVVEEMIRAWGSGTWEDRSQGDAPHETRFLRLSSDRAAARLGWSPQWGLPETVARTVEWYRAALGGASTAELRAMMSSQIGAYAARAE